MREHDYLYHYGVMGMHWGVRKDQPGVTSRRKNHPPSADHMRTKELRKKKLSEMSNDELQVVIRRLQLERQYKDLTPGVLKRGKQAISSSIFGRTAKSVQDTTAKAYGAKIVKAAMTAI